MSEESKKQVWPRTETAGPATGSSLGGAPKPTSGQRVVVFVIILVTVTAGLILLWTMGRESQMLMIIVAAIVGAVGIFPFTYIAYLGFGAKAQRKRLEDDFRLLGLESEEKLGETVEQLYQTVYSPVQFTVYIVLIIVLSLLVLGGYLRRDTLTFVSTGIMTLVFYGYAGAYVFAIQQLVRRYNTFDLQPQVYSSILVRMLMAIIITFVGASVIGLSGAEIAGQENTATEAPQAWSAILAFVIGVFPTRGLRWFVQQSNQALSSSGVQTVELPLGALLGIGTWHEARLSEMGIDDAQNLATVDIRRLLLTTQFDTQAIIHWIDQAILYAKVGAKIDRFRDAKIATFHEYRQVQAGLTLTPLMGLSNAERDRRQELRKRLTLALGLLDEDELDRLGDFSCHTNYSHIAEYYSRMSIVARQRAKVGMEIVAGAIRETNYERAVEDGERLRLQNPDDPILLNNLGYAYYRLDKLDNALACYNDAIRLSPNLAEAYYNRSLIYIDRGDFDAAVRDCTEALRISRTNAKALNNRGLAYMKMGYLDRAIEDLNEALRIDDRLAEAYLNRGVTCNAQFKFQQAAQDLEKAYLLGDRLAELWLAWGIALMGLRNYVEAVEKLSQAVLYETDSAKAYANRGYAYFQLGPEYYQQARVDLETAVQRDKHSPDAYSNLGLLEARLNNYEAAIARYQESLKVDPSQFVTHYNLAVAYQQIKKVSEAREQFSQVIALAPKDSFESEQARQSLASLSECDSST